MLLGTKTFECDKCRNKFEGMAMEYMCTSTVAPLKCPKCGSWHTFPASTFPFFGLSFLQRMTYESIWNSMDQIENKSKK